MATESEKHFGDEESAEDRRNRTQEEVERGIADADRADREFETRHELGGEILKDKMELLTLVGPSPETLKMVSIEETAQNSTLDINADGQLVFTYRTEFEREESFPEVVVFTPDVLAEVPLETQVRIFSHLSQSMERNLKALKKLVGEAENKVGAEKARREIDETNRFS